MDKFQEFRELARMIMRCVNERTPPEDAIEASIQMYDLKLAFFETDDDVQIATDIKYLMGRYHCPLCKKYWESGCENCPLVGKIDFYPCSETYYKLYNNPTRANLIALAEEINNLREDTK